jgi:hypothetical protein
MAVNRGGREEKEHGGVQCGDRIQARTVVTRGLPAPSASRSTVGSCLTGKEDLGRESRDTKIGFDPVFLTVGERENVSGEGGTKTYC